MVVAVRRLGGPAGVHHVDLGGDLIGRAEPGRRDQGDDLVGVVLGEGFRGANGHLLQGVPHAVVRARLGEVVTRGRARRALVGDQGVEHVRGPIDDRPVGEGALEHHDAGTVAERPDQLGLHLAAPLRAGRERSQPIAVVQRDIPVHRIGQRIVTRLGDLLDQSAEVVQVAISLGQPGPGSCSSA